MSSKNYPNLKPYEPGVSGNPSGKKKGTKSMRTILTKIARTKFKVINPLTDWVDNMKAMPGQGIVIATTKQQLKKKKKELLSMRDIWMMNLAVSAYSGNSRAIKMAHDILEGKPKQPIEIAGTIKNTYEPDDGLKDMPTEMVEELLKLHKKYGEKSTLISQVPKKKPKKSKSK